MTTWNKYKVEKKQIYTGGTWVDSVPLETRTGEKIGEYDSFLECMNNTYSDKYLSFVALEDTAFSFSATNPTDQYVEYSLDSGTTWVTMYSGETTPTISAGNSVLWRGDLVINGIIQRPLGNFTSTGRFNVEGNAMSLLYGDNFEGQELTNTKKLSGIFAGTKVVDAGNLVLPSTNLIRSCYTEMFSNCASLTTAPKLPATTLANYCYNSMFMRCTSLTTAPELPATTLNEWCYYQMFFGCINLNYIKMLATDISAYQCLTDWVYGVSSTGTFVKNSAASWDASGYNGVPNNWTIQTASS